MGTDLEVGIRIDVPGIVVERPGSVVLPISRFRSILRESSDEKLEMESDGRKTLVRGQRSEFQLPAENPDEFPERGGLRGREVSRDAGPLLPRDRPPHGLRHRQREQPLRPGRRAGRVDRRRDHGRGHRRPPAGQAGRPGQVGRRPPVGRQHHDHPHPGHATDRAGPGRQRREHPTLPPATTTCWSAAAGRRSTRGWSKGDIPSGATSSRGARTTSKVELAVGPFYAAVRQAAIVTSEERRGVDFTFGGGKVVLAGARGRIRRVARRTAHRLRRRRSR